MARNIILLVFTSVLVGSLRALVLHGESVLVADTVLSLPLGGLDNVTFAGPMQPLSPGNGNFFVVGTDELNCSTKDASGANVKAAPTRGFIQFNYTLPTGGFHAFDFTTYAPDGMSNSFYAQHDGGATLIWNTKMAKVPTRMTMEVDTSIVFTAKCFDLAPGMHNVRLYAREPGAAVNRLQVVRMPPLFINATMGCQPCRARGGEELRITLFNFCGKPMLHPGLIRLNGAICRKLSMTSDNDIVCVTPSIPEREDYGVELTVHVNPDDAGFAPNLITPLTMEQPSRFPTWAIGVIAAGCALIVLLLPMPLLRRYWTHRHAPKDATGPIAVAFCTIPGIEVALENDPKRTTDAQRLLYTTIRHVARRHSVYYVRRVGTAELIVAKHAAEVLKFAAELQKRLEAEAANDDSVLNSGLLPDNAPLLVGTSLHFGPAVAVEDDDTGRYDFNGAAVDDCARIADVCQGGQILVSTTVESMLAATGDAPTTWVPEEFMNLQFSDEEAGDRTIYTLRTPAFRNLHFEPPKADELAAQNTSMSAALQQSQGGFATKQITVLVIRLVMRCGSRDAPLLYRRATQMISEIIARFKGVHHTFHGDIVVITFNAKTPAVGHTKKAALTAVAIQNEVLHALRRRVHPIGAIATGMATFGRAGEHDFIHGAALDRALELLQQLATLLTRSRGGHTDSLSTQARDGLEGSDHHSEASDVVSAGRTSSRRGGGTGVDGSSRSSCLTDPMPELMDDPHAMRLHSSGLHFVCDGALMRDLQHTVTLVVLGTVPNIMASVKRTLESCVTIAGIIGERKMSEDEEWQYDLDRADNSNDTVAIVNRAFYAYAEGRIDDARQILLRVDKAHRTFGRCRVAVRLLNEYLHDPLDTSHGGGGGPDSEQNTARSRGLRSPPAVSPTTDPSSFNSPQPAASLVISAE
jgi:class 3 adenylate cyclase